MFGPSVTVIGSGGSTVTIPFTSAANAAAAQAAVASINTLSQLGYVQQQALSGSATIAGPSGSIIGVGGVVTGSATVNAGVAPDGALDLFTNSSGRATLTGALNPMTVVAGSGGVTFIGRSANSSQLFFGGGNGTYVAADGANAAVNVDGANNWVWAYGSNTDTAVNVYDGATVGLIFGNGSGGGGTGNFNVFVQNGATATVTNAMYNGAANPGRLGAAITMNGNANLNYVGTAQSAAGIEQGAGNFVAGANSGYLNIDAGSGRTTVISAHGLIASGSGGNSYIGADSLAGATTLQGYGAGDTLAGGGAGDVLIAHGANSTIQDNSGTSGNYYQLAAGGTIFGATGAVSSIHLGAGSNLAYGQHGNGTAGSSYYDDYTGANTITIGDFVEGLDYFTLSRSLSGATLSSLSYYADAKSSPFAAAGTQAILSDGTQIDFLNAKVTNTSFN